MALGMGADGTVFDRAARLQERPSEDTDDEASGDADHGHGDAEKLQHGGAEEERAEQKEKAADTDAAGEEMTFTIRTMARGAEEERCSADRIYDREKAGIDEQEGVDDRVHGTSDIRFDATDRSTNLLAPWSFGDACQGREEAGVTPAQAVARLRAAGIEEPEREVRLLLAHTHGEAPDPGGFASSVERRARREPMALITGEREFWSLPLAVPRATLIPRPESETLVEAALEAFQERRAVKRILDLGTGTGALLLALVSEFAEAFGVGIDRIEAAAHLAACNAEKLGLNAQARFLVGDWSKAIAGRFDLIVANPPYVQREAIDTLMPEVRVYEPASALDGGTDGLDAYRLILPDLPRLLAPLGVAIVEVGAGASAAVVGLARHSGLEVGRVSADLSGIPRAIALRC